MSDRGRGRPRLDPSDRSVDVHFRLPARDYDRAYAARERDEDVPDVMRRALQAYLVTQKARGPESA